MVTFSLVEDGADRCLGGINRKRQLSIGTGKANVVALAKQDFKSSKASNCSLLHFYWAVWCTSKRGNGRSDCRVVQDETAIEVDHTKESSELASGSRIRVFRYRFDFGLEGPKTLVLYHVTKETYFGSPKAAFVRVHHQSVIV